MAPAPVNLNNARVVNQVLAVILQNRPFDASLASSTKSAHGWSTHLVSDVLRSIPLFLFQSPRSVGRQNSFRHRTPLKQRNLKKERRKAVENVLILGPAAHRDRQRVALGVCKALEFYYWVESSFGFRHCELTCREMACVLARGNGLSELWAFLWDMSQRRGDDDARIVSVVTVTCLIKVLGEEGLVNEAVRCFYRMKQLGCKPDVYAYNAVILALCRVGMFDKARFLLNQMELPGFRCPADTYTYTIMISSYCKYGMQTGCRKAIRRRIWEANHLFRIMLFKGFSPDVVTYNSLIDGCCKTNRIERTMELYNDMIQRGCAPNRVTYDSIIRYFSVANEVDKAIEMLRRMESLNHGVPTSSSYTPIIHSLCEAGRVEDARDFLVEMVQRGSIPREYTYKLVCDVIAASDENIFLDGSLHSQIQSGINNRCCG
ncbi:hypothetical protein MLD38_001951 [Melastoma candidum]|uniref:Uncharacterized protein n=1 Tax=Melastoma candidum TaxID=119954 RepID=A0ACB9SF03_9MYRT|nr:hypothetical protein MLD38_001951 [Melastoma candidum]